LYGYRHGNIEEHVDTVLAHNLHHNSRAAGGRL
jgi:hypothetical protein